MKNQPTSIFLDLRWKINPDHDFNDFSHITWSVDNATGNGLEYVSKDEMFEFAAWMLWTFDTNLISIDGPMAEFYKQFKTRAK